MTWRDVFGPNIESACQTAGTCNRLRSIRRERCTNSEALIGGHFLNLALPTSFKRRHYAVDFAALVA